MNCVCKKILSIEVGRSKGIEDFSVEQNEYGEFQVVQNKKDEVVAFFDDKAIAELLILELGVYFKYMPADKRNEDSLNQLVRMIARVTNKAQEHKERRSCL